jgi:tetratricopeptide (TPR) repeat protein
LTAKGQLEASITAWKKVLELDPRNAKAHNYLGNALMWQGNLAEGTAHLQKARELDPEFNEVQSDFGIAFYNREQFRAAMKKSDCDSATSFGNKLLAVSPHDAEVEEAVADCALKQNRQQMRAALEKSDWPAALSFANKVLALVPGDAEAQKAVRECDSAVSRPE